MRIRPLVPRQIPEWLIEKFTQILTITFVISLAFCLLGIVLFSATFSAIGILFAPVVVVGFLLFQAFLTIGANVTIFPQHPIVKQTIVE